MSIYAKNKSMSNCKVGNNQVSKIVFNGKTIWENWKKSTDTKTCSISWSGGTETGSHQEKDSGWVSIGTEIKNITSAVCHAEINQTAYSGWFTVWLKDASGNTYQVASLNLRGGASVYDLTTTFTRTDNIVYTHYRCKWSSDDQYWACNGSGYVQLKEYYKKGS